MTAEDDGLGEYVLSTQYSYNNNNTKLLYLIQSHVIMEQVAGSRGEGRVDSSDRVGFQMALYHTRPAGERALTYSDHGSDHHS